MVQNRMHSACPVFHTVHHEGAWWYSYKLTMHHNPRLYAVDPLLGGHNVPLRLPIRQNQSAPCTYRADYNPLIL